LEGRGKKEEIGGQRLFWGDFYRSIDVVGKFGFEGQETARILRSREPERLFLVGWEVNMQFGKFGQFGQKQEQMSKGINQPNL
jgi:hypothetical protein